MLHNANDTMPFVVANPAAHNKPTVYIGVVAVLNFSFTNNTGGDIKMKSGTDTSTLEVMMPTYFTAEEVKGMKVTQLSQGGWNVSYKKADTSLLFTWTGADGTWLNNDVLSFTISNVLSNHAPAVDSIVVNIENVDGVNVPGTVFQTLGLNNPSPVVNTDLMTVLERTLDNQGSVFVSVLKDPLTNTVYLNFKNKGTTSLYNDSIFWTVSPQVFISFVYGYTAGALAPADKKKYNDTGSAWLISVSLGVSQGWGCTNPKITDGNNTPVWTLYPLKQNQQVLGTGENANVTFAFSNIVSLLATGHTQMYLQFSNFMANSKKPYDPALVTLDMVKLLAPPTRGILNFFATNGPVIPLPKPEQTIEIQLQAKLYYVDNVLLSCNVAGIPVQKFNYWKNGQTPALQDVTYTITLLEENIRDTVVFFTLQAFGNNGGYLNAMQFTVFFQGNSLTDPDGHIYPTVFLNNQTWLAENYQYSNKNGPGIMVYNHEKDPSVVQEYGLLYTASAAQSLTPAGWRLPTQADWQGLFNSLGSSAFKALMSGGGSQFSAVAGGYCDNLDNSGALTTTGYYWTSTPDPATAGNNFISSFFIVPGSVNALGSFPETYYLSVRYVKNS